MSSFFYFLKYSRYIQDVKFWNVTDKYEFGMCSGLGKFQGDIYLPFQDSIVYIYIGRKEKDKEICGEKIAWKLKNARYSHVHSCLNFRF